MVETVFLSGMGRGKNCSTETGKTADNTGEGFFWRFGVFSGVSSRRWSGSWFGPDPSRVGA